MDLVGFICLVLAAAVLAANQALKDAPTLTDRVQWLRPQGWRNYLPLGFVGLASAAYLISWATPENKLPSLAKREVPTIAAKGSTVVSGIDIARLIALRKQHSGYEYQLLTKPFADTPVSISGTIENLWRHDDGSAYVSVNPTANGIWSDLEFDAQYTNDVLRLPRGGKISANCKFRNLGILMLFLHHCKLLPSP